MAGWAASRRDISKERRLVAGMMGNAETITLGRVEARLFHELPWRYVECPSRSAKTVAKSNCFAEYRPTLPRVSEARPGKG